MGFLQQIALPTDISRHGNLIDWLFNYTTIMNLFFFALVCGGLFGFCYFYHHRRHPKAYYTYGNKKRHLMVTALLGVLVFLSIDLNIVRISNDDYLKVFNNWPSEKEDIFRVEVLAQQWAWSFRYPGEDGNF